MPTSNLCNCMNNIIQNNINQCKSCGNSLCDQECKNIILKQREKIIQNQVRVSESQMIDVKGAITIGSDYLNNPANSSNYPFKNMSDRRNASVQKSWNVSSRGNSVRSSVTSCKPGSLTPGGKGVDVKHGSYARYLGKLKSKNIVSNEIPSIVPDVKASRLRPAMNNKQYRFSIINTNQCKCNS